MAPSRVCLFVLVVALALLFFSSDAAAAARSDAGTAAAAAQRRRQAQSLLRRLNKVAAATIVSPDGDIIDCVHISKQPAFDHPLLKNHTIQMKPSCHPEGHNNKSSIAHNQFTQTWHQNGKCPENTIPIRRTKEEDVPRESSIERYGMKWPQSIPNRFSVDDDPKVVSVLRGHQHAVASAPENESYYGTQATFNLWEPIVERDEGFSLAQFWISSGSYANNDLNTIEAGWQVYPGLYNDSHPRLFIYWTDPKEGNWWLQVEGHDLGYWPTSIFSNLESNATSVEWGGEVASPPDSGQTSTQMGSGHFPEEGFSKASYIKNIQFVDSTNNLKSPSAVKLLAKWPKCYNVQNGTSAEWGTYIFYGGPGKNPNCQ